MKLSPLALAKSRSKLWVRLEAGGASPKQVGEGEAGRLNRDGHGVLWTVNEFEGRRLKANVTGIHYHFAEFDGGTKADQQRRLRESPLRPSLVVESKAGFHAYWRVDDGSMETWYPIQRGIVKLLGADPKCTDPLRLLRAPGYRHWKDPTDPFLVEAVWESDASYSSEQLGEAFPWAPATSPAQGPTPTGDGFWQRVASLDCGEAILRLNNHWLQNGESFELREQSSGNRNIVRLDSKDTGCFVRADGSIGNCLLGARLGGWLAWYHDSDWSLIAKGLKEVFPELGGSDEHD